jgi:fructokinase
MIRIGIDLGGTKIEAVALDEDGRELARERVLTPAGDYQATLRAVKGLLQTVLEKIDDDYTIGVGTPGALSRATGLLKNSNSTCLNGKPIFRDLEELIGRPIRMANDANCFVLSEATDGAAAGAQVVFGVIVGTGTGGGIVVNEAIIAGPNAIAGEWGHNQLPWMNDRECPGPQCYCGKRGCIETFLSGPGMMRDHANEAGEQLQAEEIVAKALDGDQVCASTLARYEDRMARSLAHVINVLDPDVVVLGGGMSNITRLYENVPKLWGRYVFSDQVETRLLRPFHGDSSGVRGAAMLWPLGVSGEP